MRALAGLPCRGCGETRKGSASKERVKSICSQLPTLSLYLFYRHIDVVPTIFASVPNP